MPFYYTVASSLSVRTLVLLAAEPGGRLPIDEVRERFVSRALVGQRLEIMKTNGFLAATEDGGFVLTSKGRALATVFGQLTRFWRMDAGG
jgi:Mn-dependent DtxR family transcriptional regulator